MKFLAEILLLSFCGKIDGVQDCFNIYSTCGNCSSQLSCFWCLDPPGCFPVSDDNCRSRYEINNEVTYAREDITEERQITPPKVSLRLIPGKTVEFDFNIKLASNYPIDIYFLFDFSWSMREVRENIAIQSESLLREIEKLTTDLQVGFGSFIEKNLPPFTSAIPRFNCPADSSLTCAPPYSFHHKMSLAQSTPEFFKEQIISAHLAGNVDEPEGGFDALIQAMLCDKEIGWRKNSRKIILMATDRDFHFALDGKLLGLLEPNDGKCHLNSSGYFTQESIMDYPSISQINAVASQKAFLVIFAVIPRYLQEFAYLSKLVHGSSVAILEKDTSNIVNIIESRYKEIMTNVALNVRGENSFSSQLHSIEFFADCYGNHDFKKTYICKGVMVETPIHFKARVTVNQCFRGSKSLAISPVGLSQSLVVKIESPCDCDCAKEGNLTVAEDCNMKGHLKCGLCSCLRGFSGDHCQCETEFSAEEQIEACVDPRNIDNGQCNKQGQCICGICYCSPGKYGKFCQCDDFSCPLDSKGRLCSDHGKCSCKVCDCFPDWTGHNCECSKETSACESPFNGKTCSEYGECLCNENCLCDDGYTGQFCQNFPDTSDSCSSIRSCAEDMLFSNTQPEKCKALNLVLLSNYSDLIENTEDEETCILTREDGCTYQFTVGPYSNGKITIKAMEDMNERCTYEKVDYLMISLSAVGLLALGFLFLILYKIFLIYQERREFAEFEKERKTQKYCTHSNALYQDPIAEFRNPLCNPMSKD